MHEKSAYIIIWRKHKKKDWSVVSGYTAEKCMAIYSEIFAEGRGMDVWSEISKVYLGTCTAVYSQAFGFIYEDAIGQPRETTSVCDPLMAKFEYE